MADLSWVLQRSFFFSLLHVYYIFLTHHVNVSVVYLKNLLTPGSRGVLECQHYTADLWIHCVTHVARAVCPVSQVRSEPTGCGCRLLEGQFSRCRVYVLALLVVLALQHPIVTSTYTTLDRGNGGCETVNLAGVEGGTLNSGPRGLNIPPNRARPSDQLLSIHW